MKFIVVGAAGRMGQMRVKHLRELGHTVIEYDPPVQGPPSNGLPYWWDQPADGVAICTPAALHSEQLMMAVRHDFPVFVEKPICLMSQLIDTRRSLQHALEKNLDVSVGYNLRFHPIVNLVARNIQNDDFQPLFANFVLRQNPSRKLDHFLEEWASHEIDLALYLMGNWRDAKVIYRSDHQRLQELRLMIDHMTFKGKRVTSLILADAYTNPPVRTFTLTDRYGKSVSYDIEKDHVEESHYKDEIEAWTKHIEDKMFMSPLAHGFDAITSIDILQRMTVRNGHRKSESDRARTEA